MNTVDLTRPAGKPYTQEQREYLQARQKEKLEATFRFIPDALKLSLFGFCSFGIITVLLPILFSGSIPSINAIPPLVITVAVVGSVDTVGLLFHCIYWGDRKTENIETLNRKLFLEMEDCSPQARSRLLGEGATVSLDLLKCSLSTLNVQTYLSQGGDVSQLDQVLLQDTFCKPSDAYVVLDCILIAVDHGFDVNSLSPAGNSVLHRYLSLHQISAYCKRQFISFLDAGADPTLKNRQGETVMDLLFDDRLVKSFFSVDGYSRYLNDYIPAIARKAPQLINQPLKNSNSPLLDIVARPPPTHGPVYLKQDHLNIVKFLITHGANVNAQDPAGDTALHIAARKDDVELFGLLLQKGAKNDIRNKAGQTPLALIQANLSEKGESNIWKFMKQNSKNAMYEAFIVKHLPSGTT